MLSSTTIVTALEALNIDSIEFFSKSNANAFLGPITILLIQDQNIHRTLETFFQYSNNNENQLFKSCSNYPGMKYSNHILVVYSPIIILFLSILFCSSQNLNNSNKTKVWEVYFSK